MFQVGKKVIAICNASDGTYKQGNTYTLEGMKRHCSHYPLILDIGVRELAIGGHGCPACGVIADCNIKYVTAKSFIPYDDTLSTITADELIKQLELQIA